MNFFSKRNTAFLVFIFSFIIYSLTVAPGLMFTDSGELAAVCTTLGIAHPTGYPLFTVLGFIWSQLNIFGMPQTQHLNFFAVAMTALSVLVSYYLVLTVLDIITAAGEHKQKKNKKDKKPVTTTIPENLRIIIAVATALTYAFALTIWQQAVMFEVYSLQLLMFNLIIFSMLRAWVAGDSSRKYLYLAAFFTGLGFANHMTTMLLLPALLFLFFYKRNAGFDFSSERIKLLFVLVLPFALGLSLYLYLPLRSATMPEFNWGWVSRSFDKFWYHVSGKQYRVWMFSDAATMKTNAEKFFSIFLYQFGWLGVIPLIAGFIHTFRKSKAVFWFAALLLISNLIYALNYGIHDIETYFSLSFIALIILTGVGLFAIFREYAKYAALALLIPLLSLALNYSENDYSSNRLVPEYTKTLVNNLDSNAIVISAQWDYFCSAFWYMQRVENYRPDVVLVEKELLRRTWYLEQFKRWYPEVARKSEKEMKLYLSQLELFEDEQPYDPFLIQKYFIDLVNSFIAKNIDERPVYITPDILQSAADKDIAAGYNKVPAGFAFKLVKDKPDYIPDLSKINVDKLIAGHYDREDHLVRGILETASMGITNIGRYAQYNGNIALARKAYYMALKVYPENQAASSSLRGLGK